jgi:hypothetical protein
MSRTSRNTLMIGGALILIALLLVCGPLSDRLGSGGSKIEEAPPVAAAPPVDAARALDAAASGALAGGTLGEVRADAVAADAGVGAGEVAAGTAIALGSTVAAVTADGAGSAAPASPPPVSAGVPSTPVAAEAPATAIPALASAAGIFDDAVDSARDSNDGIGPAGRLVDRFPPPVAAAADSGLRVASSLNDGPLIYPCDSPGSGCRNVAVGGGPRPPGGVNPPIIPGGRPPSPIRNNPPIVPGVR